MDHSRDLSEWDLQRVDTRLTHRLDQLGAEWRRRFDEHHAECHRRFRELESELSTASHKVDQVKRDLDDVRSTFAGWLMILCGPGLLAVVIWTVVIVDLARR